MPAGPVLAGIYDRHGDAIALSRPFSVPAVQVVKAKPTPPTRDSDLLVILHKPMMPGDVQVSLTVSGQGRPRPPDVFVDAQDYVYGVWYGVRGSNATVSLESNALVLPPTSVALRPGRVSTIRTDLSRKPTLKVSVRAPEKSFDKMQVIIRRIDGTEIRNATIGVDESVETL